MKVFKHSIGGVLGATAALALMPPRLIWGGIGGCPAYPKSSTSNDLAEEVPTFTNVVRGCLVSFLMTLRKYSRIAVVSAAVAVMIFPAGVEAVEPPPEFLNSWDTEAGPRGVAVDSSDNVYIVALSANRVQKFTRDGSLITSWGGSGSGDGQFSDPHYIAVDASDNVYVSDTDNARIQKFSKDGTFITKWGSPGNADGQFSGPRGIAIDSSGNVYVADSLNDRVQKFTPEGAFLAKWGSPGNGPGEFQFPEGIAVDSLDNVYVGEFEGDRIQKFSDDGTFIAAWRGDLSGPEGITIDASDNLFVGDRGNSRAVKFTSEGTFLTEWGPFDPPGDLAVDSADLVYITEENADRVQVFRPVPSVAIDVRPGSEINAVHPALGMIPVAVLTTSESAGETGDFDALQVDPTSVRLGRDGATVGISSRNVQVIDVDNDGDADLRLRFRARDTGIRCDDEEVELRGETFAGEQVFGRDEIRPVLCN